jgi:hypothetical protein
VSKINKLRFTIDFTGFDEESVRHISKELNIEMKEGLTEYKLGGEFEDTEENWIWLRVMISNISLPVTIEKV